MLSSGTSTWCCIICTLNMLVTFSSVRLHYCPSFLSSLGVSRKPLKALQLFFYSYTTWTSRIGAHCWSVWMEFLLVKLSISGFQVGRLAWCTLPLVAGEMGRIWNFCGVCFLMITKYSKLLLQRKVPRCTRWEELLYLFLGSKSEIANQSNSISYTAEEN